MAVNGNSKVLNNPATVFPDEISGNIQGSKLDELIYSGGISTGEQIIEGNGGSDTLILDADDLHADDNANLKNARILIRDFVIAGSEANAQADRLDVGAFLGEVDLDANNLGDYMHVVSDGSESHIYLNKEGDFSAFDRFLIEAMSGDGFFSNILSSLKLANGADLVVTLGNEASESERGGAPDTANLETITGFADNTAEQFQALIDLGFLGLSNSSRDIWGTRDADELEGNDQDNDLYSLGLSDGVESIRGNGGADTLIIQEGDSHADDKASTKNAHFRIKDFIIGDTVENPEADVLNLSGTLNGVKADGSNLGNYFHIISGAFGGARTVVFVDTDGKFTDEKRIELSNDVRSGGQGADYMLEFQGLEANNNFAELTGKADNTVEQLQVLLDWGFLQIDEVQTITSDNEGPHLILGSDTHTSIIGSDGDDIILPGNITDNRVETIYTNGGSDTLVFSREYATASNDAGIEQAHFRIKDFTIGNLKNNTETDVLDVSGLLQGVESNGSNLADYFHIISGAFGDSRTVVFIDKEGQFTDEKRIALSNNVTQGGYGADLMLEFQGLNSTNNFATLTGEADNTIEQLQALLDMGFLKVDGLEYIKRHTDDTNLVLGSDEHNNIIGSDGDDIILPGHVTDNVVENIYSNGGRDTLVFSDKYATADDDASSFQGHFRINDFVIGDTKTNSEADTLDLKDLFSTSVNVFNVGDHLHIISGQWGDGKTAVFIDKDGVFTEEERAALDANPNLGGHGADLLIKFQNQNDSNNFEVITGYEDNSHEQIKALIDMGFLEIA